MDTMNKNMEVLDKSVIRREREKTVSLCDDVSEASTEVSHVDSCEEDSSAIVKKVHRARKDSEQSCDSQTSTRGKPRTVSFLLPLDDCRKDVYKTILSISELCLLHGPRQLEEGQLTCVVPVHKEKLEGGIDITMEPSVITKKDGSRIIITEDGAKHLPPAKKVRPKDISSLKVFCVISLVLFPPLGFLAMYLTNRTNKEFSKGLQIGDMDKTYTWKKRTENAVIVSIICGLLMWGAIFVLIKSSAGSSSLNSVSV